MDIEPGKLGEREVIAEGALIVDDRDIELEKNLLVSARGIETVLMATVTDDLEGGDVTNLLTNHTVLIED